MNILFLEVFRVHVWAIQPFVNYFRKRLNDEQFVRMIYEKEALETGHFVIISAPKKVLEPFYVAQVIENDFHTGKRH
jgi:hypothetical protein